MAYTYIPTFVILVVFFLGTLITMTYFIYTIYSVYKNFNRVRDLTVLDKIVLFTLLFYSVILFGVFVVHLSMSGLYHDSHGTGPSYIEHNFNIINILFVLVVLGLCNNLMNKVIRN